MTVTCCPWLVPASLLASGTKDDPRDSELALELMLRYPQKIKAIEPDNADIYMGVSTLINKYRWISDMVMAVADM